MRLNRIVWIAACFVVLTLAPFHSAQAQTRISDKDLERIMKNLRED